MDKQAPPAPPPAVRQTRQQTDARLSAERRRTDDALEVLSQPQDARSATELPAEPVTPDAPATAAVPQARLQRERAKTDERLRLERTRNDVKLEAAEEPFRLLVAQLEEYAIFLLAPDGRVTSWNIGAEQMLGYRRDEIVGRPHATLARDTDVAAGLPGEELDAARRQGRVFREAWMVRRDGTSLYAAFALTAIHGPDGEVRGFAKVVRDVTERVTEAEQSIRRSEETLRLAMEAGGFGSWDWRVDGDELLASDACRRLFGLRLDGPAPPSLERLLVSVHPDDRDRAGAAVERALGAAGDGAFEIDLRVVGPDGGVRWIAWSGRATRSSQPSGSATRRMVGVVRDVTERK